MFVRSAAFPQLIPSNSTTPAAPSVAPSAPAMPTDSVSTTAQTASAPATPATTSRPDLSVAVAASPIGGPLGQALASESERLAEFFNKGGGSTKGFQAPEVAQGLLDAQQAGAKFLSGGRDPEPISPVEAYQTLISPNAYAGSVYLGLDGVQMVACQRDTLRSGIDAFVPFAEAHREVLRRGRFDGYAMQCALDRVAGQRTPEAINRHADLLVTIYDNVKASGRHAASSEEAAHAMCGVYDWLAPQLGDLPSQRVDDVLAWTARGGAEEARKAGTHGRTLEGDAYLEFDRTMRTLGNVEASKQALAAVEQPISGSDTRAERFDTLQRISALHSQSATADEALGDYRAVSAAWKGDEALAAVTDRFVTLHRSLAARGCADQTRSRFEGLERHWRASGEGSPERTYMTFLDQVRRTGSVDLAVLETGISASAATIERHAGGIIVGGVRLPIREA